MKEPTPDDALAKQMEAEGYFALRYIEGKLCGLYTFAFTYGVVINMDDISYERRYCFENMHDACDSMAKYKNISDTHPSGPWIKCKGRFKGEPIDLLNPEIK